MEQTFAAWHLYVPESVLRPPAANGAQVVVAVTKTRLSAGIDGHEPYLQVPMHKKARLFCMIAISIHRER